MTETPNALRIGIYGGSFDPPHIGHLIVAEQVRDQFRLDRLIWVPGYIPPHKQDHALMDAGHRLAMVELATSRNPGFEVSRIEIERQGISFTVDTLEQISTDNPGAELFLVLGGDSYAAFESWYEPDRIRQLARLIVYNRNGASFNEENEEGVSFADGPLIEISSTLVRNAIRSGKSIRYMVTEGVFSYIEANGLYD